MAVHDAWFKPSSSGLTCNQHPKPPRELVKLLSAHTGLTIENTRHALDRMRHLTTCCREPDQLTLLRLHPGSRQVRQPSELEIEAMAEGTPEPAWLRSPPRAGQSDQSDL